jgi:hypothetical protein
MPSRRFPAVLFEYISILCNCCSELSWIRSEVLSLTHFSVLAGVMVACSGGSYLPLIAGYMAGAIVVIVSIVWLLVYKNIAALKKVSILEKTIKDLKGENQALNVLMVLQQQTSNKLYRGMLTLGRIKEDLMCPITQEMPRDPVITSTGYVCSGKALEKYFHHVRDYRCPINRARLSALEVVDSRKLANICDEIRKWESLL